MKKSTLFLFLSLLCSYGKAQQWQLVWSDEFNGEGAPDPAVWNFERGFVRNQEAQWYQTENAYQQDGFLIIDGRNIVLILPTTQRVEIGVKSANSSSIRPPLSPQHERKNSYTDDWK